MSSHETTGPKLLSITHRLTMFQSSSRLRFTALNNSNTSGNSWQPKPTSEGISSYLVGNVKRHDEFGWHAPDTA